MVFQDVRLPKQISPCPISECIIEIRFQAKVEAEAVFGIIYNVFRNDFNKVEKLPILQLPEAVRSVDPNLMFQPVYRLSAGRWILQIGARVLSLSCVGEYLGWTVISEKANWAFGKLQSLDFLSHISRFGIRYINFFEDLDIFENITLRVSKDGQPLQSRGAVLRFELFEREFLEILHIAKPAEAPGKSGKITSGSVIDIDIVKEPTNRIAFDEIPSVLETSHVVEKTIFFGLLEPTFLQTLNPIYEEN
jgi:uncharacterized protein (TIGR04255 family)